MPIRCLIKAGEYHDSVALMQTAQELSQLPGVRDAAVVMATEANKGILREAGLLLPEIEAATPNDLIIVAQAQSKEVAQSTSRYFIHSGYQLISIAVFTTSFVRDWVFMNH